MSYLEVKNLSASYADRRVLHDLRFGVETGEIAGILGANGCGKTTLLKSICNILPHAGSCLLNGAALEKLSPRAIARRCSYIPQRSGISIDISALDVVLMGFNARLSLLEQPSARMRDEARQALELVGLRGRADENYLSLSEGQKQLCILARSLVSEASLLLLDEPESALDFRRRHQVLNLIRNWIDAGERCALISLHDPQLALSHCDRLILIHEGQVSDVLFPRNDPLPRMEAALLRLYGAIELNTCADRDGNRHIIMLYKGDMNQ